MQISLPLSKKVPQMHFGQLAIWPHPSRLRFDAEKFSYVCALMLSSL